MGGSPITPTDGTLHHALAQLPDHRSTRGRSYSLASLLTFAATTMLCGAKSLYAIAQWGRDYNHLAPLLGFTKPRLRGRPGHRTPCVGELHAVFAKLDIARFEAALTGWVSGRPGSTTWTSGSSTSMASGTAAARATSSPASTC